MGDVPINYVEGVGGTRVSEDDIVAVGKHDVSAIPKLQNMVDLTDYHCRSYRSRSVGRQVPLCTAISHDMTLVMEMSYDLVLCSDCIITKFWGIDT
jgi:hypothetical protein